MIIFIYGEDTFQSRRKLKELKNRFTAKFDQSGAGLAVIDGAAAALEKINEAAGPVSLFSDKRLVVIENIFLNKKEAIFKELTRYLKEKKLDKILENDGGNIIIFWDELGAAEKLPAAKNELFKFLNGQKFRYVFKNLTGAETTAWVKKETESRGGKISRLAAGALAAIAGADLWQANTEIDKLINYKSGQKLKLADGEKGLEITEEDVKKMARGKFDENIFALTDAIGNKNKKLAARLLEEQIEAGLTDSYLLTMVIRQFRILAQIKQALNNGMSPRQIAGALKLHPFVAQKGAEQTRYFSLPALKNIFNQLVRIDFLMKTGATNAKTGLSLLMAKM